jgi:hypothetical protein
MKQPAINSNPKFDRQAQRAGIRRTAWIVGAVAVAVFVLFFVKQGIWH